MLKVTKSQAVVSCKKCGREFARNRKHLAREKGGPFCSLSCAAAFRAAGARNPNYRGGKRAKNCLVCKKPFLAVHGMADKAKYCSRECQRRSLIGRPSPKKIHLAPKECPACGSEFVPGRPQSRYCSIACKHDGQSRRMMGTAAPNYIDGRAKQPYPRGWNRPLKERVRERDGRRCRLCELPEEKSKRRLSVHHVNHTKEDLAGTNLLTLCNTCHIRIHGLREDRDLVAACLYGMVLETYANPA